MTEDEVYSYIRRFLTALARFELCRANPTLKFLHNLAEALEMEMTIELKPKSEYDDFFKELLARESEFR